MQEKSQTPESALPHMPDAETIRLELGKARSINDLTGKDGVSARLFGQTLTAMLEGELSGHLGYERYEPKGRNSGNSRNGKRSRAVCQVRADVLQCTIPARRTHL